MFRKINRAGKLVTWTFLVASYLGGAITGIQVQRWQTPAPPPPAEVVIYSGHPEATRNLSKEVREILRKVADKKISAEEAARQIGAAFKITMDNVDAWETIRGIAGRAAFAASNDKIEDLAEAALEVFKSLHKPPASPEPTADIVFPGR